MWHCCSTSPSPGCTGACAKDHWRDSRPTASANTGASAKTKSTPGSKVRAEATMLLDTRATLGADIGKGGRVNGKETMARRRYQEGCLFMRGCAGRRVWVARWREDVLRPEGTVGRL